MGEYNSYSGSCSPSSTSKYIYLMFNTLIHTYVIIFFMLPIGGTFHFKGIFCSSNEEWTNTSPCFLLAYKVSAEKYAHHLTGVSLYEKFFSCCF